MPVEVVFHPEHMKSNMIDGLEGNVWSKIEATSLFLFIVPILIRFLLSLVYAFYIRCH